MSKVLVDVVSAEESIFSGEAEFVVAPSSMGEVGIYPNHAPMITTLKPGSVRIKISGKNEGNIDYAKAQAELAEAVAQVQAIQRLRKKK
jgi:F-type H+-transporting ATPase subunit epsilon